MQTERCVLFHDGTAYGKTIPFPSLSFAFLSSNNNAALSEGSHVLLCKMHNVNDTVNWVKAPSSHCVCEKYAVQTYNKLQIMRSLISQTEKQLVDRGPDIGTFDSVSKT